MDTLDQLTGSGRSSGWRWLCLSCMIEYSNYLLKEFKKSESDLPESESSQMEKLKELREEMDAHMRAFVIRRDN